MRTRNEELHAEVERIAELKLQVPPLKQIAEKHHVRVQTVRKLMSRAMRMAKINKDTISRETEMGINQPM